MKLVGAEEELRKKLPSKVELNSGRGRHLGFMSDFEDENSFSRGWCIELN